MTGTNQSNYKTFELFGRTFTVRVLSQEESEKRDLQEQKDREKERREYIKQLRINSLMDKKFFDCNFNNFICDAENQKYMSMAYRYADRFYEMRKNNIGLLIYGLPGTGKSYLSFCIVNKLLSKGVSVIACTSSKILQRVRELSSFGQEGTDSFLNSLQRVDLLLIDDLGAEENNSWAVSKLYEIIDARYRAEKPLIITTNLELKSLEKRLTSADGVARTFDRIVEMCQPIEIKVTPRRKGIGQSKREIFERLMR